MDVRTAKTRLLLCLVAATVIIAGGGLHPVQSWAQGGADFERGVAEFRAGNYAAAAVLFAHAESVSPGTTDALLYRAKSLVHLQDFSGAERALRTYCASHRDSSDALYLLGFVLNRENRPSESLETYTRAAAIVAPSGDDLKIVGLNYVLLDDYPDAIKWLEKAVALDTRNKDAWYYLGRAYYTKSRLVEARKVFSKILEIDPRDARAENNLGLIFESDAQPSAAIEAFQNAIAWQGQDLHASEQPYVNFGSLLIEEGRPREAIEPLEKAAKLAPDNAYCRQRLGTAYLRTGQLNRAQRELEKSTQLDPESAAAHYQLGRLYKEIHAIDLAKAEFERTAELQARSAGSVQPSQSH